MIDDKTTPTLTSEEITARRTALGLSKSALAREADLNVSTVCSIEKKRLNPYPGQVRKLLSTFERLEAERAAVV